MSISSDQFKVQCQKFVEFCTDWSLNEHVDKNTPYILSKNEFRKIGNNVYGFEYNVIYSESYEVPVMYFSVHKQDGSIAGLEEVLVNSTEDSVVSQVEHPVLFRPFYQVHPCKTRDFMKFHHVSNYLIAWLSTIGTLIDLKFDVQPQSLSMVQTQRLSQFEPSTRSDHAL